MVGICPLSADHCRYDGPVPCRQASSFPGRTHSPRLLQVLLHLSSRCLSPIAVHGKGNLPQSPNLSIQSLYKRYFVGLDRQTLLSSCLVRSGKGSSDRTFWTSNTPLRGRLAACVTAGHLKDVIELFERGPTSPPGSSQPGRSAAPAGRLCKNVENAAIVSDQSPW